MENNGSFNSVVENFFYGQIDENRAFPFPHFSEEDSELLKEMITPITKFCEDKINSEEFEKLEQIPNEVIQGFAELGMLGLSVPEEFGGMGLNYALYCRLFDIVGSFDGAVSVFLGAHQSIGYRALLNEGTNEQKAKWLPKLSSGEIIAAFCLTEPSSGSDAFSIKTKAVENSDGTFTINGQKLWITNGGLAKFYTVFCKTDHEEDGKKKEKISCFIIDGDQEGVSVGEKEQKMGIRASETRAIYFDNVKVPKEYLLGELGHGFKIAMNVLNSGRLSLGAACIGAMRKFINISVEHAKERKQFGQYLSEFGLIQEKIADMASDVYATESVVYLSAANTDKGMDNYYFESAICKIMGSEVLWSVMNTSMQIAGGTGYMKEYPYERFLRDSRINLIFEGTNEILKLFIGLSGLRGPAQNLKELGKITDISKALQEPIKSLGVVTKFAQSRISKMMPSNMLEKCHPDLSDHAVNFSSMLSDFSIQVENSIMKYGKKIVGNEYPIGRIANMVVELYSTLAVLSRTTAILENEKVSKEDKDHVINLTNLYCNKSRHKFISNQKEMSKNDDKITEAVSNDICKRGYNLDIVDF